MSIYQDVEYDCHPEVPVDLYQPERTCTDPSMRCRLDLPAPALSGDEIVHTHLNAAS